MESLEQALLEMEVYGFTLLEEVLNPEEVSHLKECLILCYERTGHEQNFMGTAGHVTNLPAQDPAFFFLNGSPQKATDPGIHLRKEPDPWELERPNHSS